MSDPNFNLLAGALFDVINPIVFRRAIYKVTPRDLDQILIGNGWPRKSEDYLRPIAENLTGSFDNVEEMVFFLTHILYESKGFTTYVDPVATPEDIENLKYTNKCGLEGISYHGRGWFLITWPDNYMDVSWGIGLGNRLWEDPDFLINSPHRDNLCLQSALWWWHKKVNYDKQVTPNNFGFTTDRLWELHRRNYEGWADKKKRHDLYIRICEIFKVRRPSDL